MGVETSVTLMDRQTFKLVCEQCGSLTVALPIEAQPDPCSILKCGRCGSPRGTLQSLRDTSIQAAFGIRCSGWPATGPTCALFSAAGSDLPEA